MLGRIMNMNAWMSSAICLFMSASAFGLVEATCPDNSKNNPGYAPPDSGIYGSVSREEASYRKLTIPSYPAKALEEQISGTVLVHVWIQKDHSVSDAKIEYIAPTSAYSLAVGLVDLVRSWSFNAVAIHGTPIASDVIVPVRFAIDGHVRAKPIDLPSFPNVPFLDTIEVIGHTTE